MSNEEFAAKFMYWIYHNKKWFYYRETDRWYNIGKSLVNPKNQLTTAEVIEIFKQTL